MKTVEEHTAQIMARVAPLLAIEIPLLDARGLLLAEDISSGVALPRFDNSSMDGYAVRLADVAGASEEHPAALTVIADVPAGSSAHVELAEGGCARVMTGAPVPTGTEAVVPVEWTDVGDRTPTAFEPGGTVRVRREPEAGAYIRRRGDDVAEGEMLLRSGTVLGSRQLALLASVGRDRLTVRPRPRVVVLSTGSELVEPGAAVGPGQICDSNSYALASAAQAAGAVAYRVGIVPDDPRTLLDAIEDQLVRADLVITSGGVSVGAYDVVKQVLSELGTVEFAKVAMQPGMPQGFGVVGDEGVPIFTLPGNPVSAFVSFELFVRPAIRTMLGHEHAHRPTTRAVCVKGFGSPEGKRQYARGVLETPASDEERTVRPIGGGGSHLLGDLAQANCLIVVPEDVSMVSDGDTLEVIELDEH